MTGIEMIKKAMTLLGYTDSTGEISGSQRFSSRALVVLNSIYADLYYASGGKDFIPLASASDEFELPEKLLYDVMPYGVAMMFAQSESDGDSQQLFSLLYNSKRAELTRTEGVEDVLPWVY